jgi:metallo-beta-lactamase class B
MRTLLAAIVAVALPAGQPPANLAQNSWTAAFKPFRVVDNIYYVGTADLSSFLITTPAGHILIDTAYDPKAAGIVGSIKALGFDVRDVKLLLTTQAHLDHVGGHAEIKRRSGAQVLVTEPDKAVIEDGGTSDHFLGAKNAFPAVKVDRVVHHGEIVTLGNVLLTAHLTPGHTKGTTTWTMSARDSQGRLRHVAVVGSTAVLDGVRLVDNREYPQIATDFSRTFRVLEQLKCEVFLAAHLSAFGGAAKAEAAAQGKGDQAFVDPEGCRASIERSKKAFEAELDRQRAGGRGGGPGTSGGASPAVVRFSARRFRRAPVRCCANPD